MEITFNALGVVSNVSTTDGEFRQGSVGNAIKAFFTGKSNINYIAKLTFTRPDGTQLQNVVMSIDSSTTNGYSLTLSSEWYLAIYGQASATIYLYDGNGTVAAQGQVTIAIERTDYSDIPGITNEQYNTLLSLIQNDYIRKIKSFAILDSTSDDLTPYSNDQIFYVKASSKFMQLSSGELIDYEVGNWEYYYEVAAATTMPELCTTFKNKACIFKITETGKVYLGYVYPDSVEPRNYHFFFQSLMQGDDGFYEGLVYGQNATLTSIIISPASHTNYYKKYVFANQDVDLGSHSLKTTGEIEANAIISKPSDDSSNRGALYSNKVVALDPTGAVSATSYEFPVVGTGQVEKTVATTDDVAAKQDALTFDNTPTNGSSNPVTSDGVYDAIQNVREVAEGKTKTFVLSYADTVSSVKTRLNSLSYLHAYLVSGGTKASQWTPTDITTDIKNGDYDGETIRNSLFNSNGNSVSLSAGVSYPNKGYLILRVGSSYYFVELNPTTNITFVSIGDNFYVVETDVPDRWAASTGGTSIDFNKLETAKVDLTSYVDLASAQTITGTKTFEEKVQIKKSGIEGISYGLRIRNNGWTSDIQQEGGANLQFGGAKIASSVSFVPGSDNQKDLGETSYQWHDIHIAGSIRNGGYTSLQLAPYGFRTYNMWALGDVAVIGNSSTPFATEYIKNINVGKANTAGQGLITFVNPDLTNQGNWYITSPDQNSIEIKQDTQNTGIKISRGSVVPLTTNCFTLGSDSLKWKDLYLTGNISDGTNSVSVANIAQKGQTLWLTRAVDSNGEFTIDLTQTPLTDGLYFITYGFAQAFLFLSNDLLAASLLNQSPIRTSIPVIYDGAGSTQQGMLKITVNSSTQITIKIASQTQNAFEGMNVSFYKTNLF